VLTLHILSEAGPDGGLAWLLWWVLGFFFLMVVIGWLTSLNKGSKPDVQHEAHEHDAPVKPAPKAGRRK
jgi:UDP-N-acetylmuramyl pentapeptide phosphotransferase/UDP-N-acetylglucosamine-1-phosphate transferase